MRDNRTIAYQPAGRFTAVGRCLLAGLLLFTATFSQPLFPTRSVHAQGNPPGIDVTPTSGLNTSENGQSAEFSVTLTAPPGPGEQVTIELDSSRSDEGMPSPNSLVFNESNWSSAQTVTVTGIDDAIDDGDVDYTVITHPAVSSDPASAYQGLDASDVSLTNLDNDSAGFTISPTGGLTTSENGQSDSFTVRLNSQPQASVTVSVESSNSQEGTVDKNSLSFDNNNWQTAQTVTVTGVDDTQFDGAQAYVIRLAASSSDAAYQGSLPDVSAQNLDNEQVVVTTRSDTYSTSQDVTLSQPAPGVLSNDSANNGTLSAQLEAGAAHGSITLNADGSFTYSPLAGYSGSDSFTYRAYAGTVPSDPTSVTINITPINVTAQPDSYTIDQDKVLTTPAPGVLANDSPSGPNLNAELVTDVSNGTLDFKNDGSFVYKPKPAYSGPDSFTYRARVGSSFSAPVTVSLTVNFVLRVTAQPDSYTMPESQVFTQSAPGVLANDSTNGTLLTAELASTVSHGTLSLALDGSFVYTPTLNYNGQDSFTYYARSGFVVSGPVTVTLTITLVNAPPVAAADTYLTNATSTTPFSVAAPGVLTNDSDPENLPITASVLTYPASGNLVLNTNGGFTFTPAPGFNGSASFTYMVTDSVGKTASAKATIVVDIVAPPAPTWVKPGSNGSTNDIVVGAMTLEVKISPSISDLGRVVFYRWDAQKNQRIELGSRQVPPYAITIDSAVLNYKWNQIDAAVIDRAGNRSPLQHLWILRDLPPVAYLVFIAR